MSDLAQTLTWSQNETELVSKLQAGSGAAFDWLVTYYHAPVFNVVYGILADRSDAADVTQEVFLKAFRGIGGFRCGSSLKTWLYRIAVRESLNHRRWWRRHRRNEISLEASLDEARAANEIEDLGATPYEQMETRETQSAVRAALAELPRSYRSAVLLRDLEGLSYEEVAEILEISVATVKTRILRGRRALKKALEPVLQPHQPAAPGIALQSREAASLRHSVGAVYAPQFRNESSHLNSYAAMSMDRGRGGLR